MKPEISAAAHFLSRIFLGHDNVTPEKVLEFKQRLSNLLEERFQDHWHETCPTKGQAYRCIRVCPEEAIDPILEKVCSSIGISTDDFNLPMELTLWVDPREVVCKLGDLKCQYHTVAKKDQSSGALDNNIDSLDIEYLIEYAHELYKKKQTVMIHPIHATETFIPNPYADSQGGISMAIRSNSNGNGTNGLIYSTSPPSGYDISPRGKKQSNSMQHKRNGYNGYYKGSPSSKSSGSSGSEGWPMDQWIMDANGSPPYRHQRGNHVNHHQLQGSYRNGGYLNSWDEVCYTNSYDHRSTSPSKLNGLPPPPTTNGSSGGQISQTSPTPEQIQQQMQHPPPTHPGQYPDTSSLPPPHTQQNFSHPPPPPAIAAVSNANSVGSNNSNNSSGTTSNGHPGKSSIGGSSNSKFQSNRGGNNGGRHRQSPIKDVK